MPNVYRRAVGYRPAHNERPLLDQSSHWRPDEEVIGASDSGVRCWPRSISKIVLQEALSTYQKTPQLLRSLFLIVLKLDERSVFTDLNFNFLTIGFFYLSFINRNRFTILCLCFLLDFLILSAPCVFCDSFLNRSRNAAPLNFLFFLFFLTCITRCRECDCHRQSNY